MVELGKKFSDIAGGYEEDVENDNGQRIVDVYDEFSLTILNGFSKK